MKSWKLTISDYLGGFAPAWYLDSYPSYGNKNMAGDMQNIDLTNPSYITQGPGLSNLVNPTGAGVSVLINSILETPVSAGVTYCLGGVYIYELSGTTPTLTTAAAPFWPHTISGTSVAAEDIAYYQGKVYYSYNSNASANVGMYDLTRDAETDFNDEWATAVESASISAGVPLPLEAGENDMLYLGNKERVSSYDGTTWLNADLDLPQNTEIQDLKWSMNRLWISANRPDLSGSNKTTGSIYVYDGASDSWEYEIRPGGRMGALFIDGGILYVFYQDITTTGGYKLGYISGGNIKEVASFKGSLPTYSQVTKYKGFIIWVGGGLIYAFGAIDKSLPSMTFQLADGGYSTVGALATPFGTPIVASYEGSNYQLAKFANYDVNCYWKSLMFPVGQSVLRKLIAYCDTLGSGARADFTITTDRGANSYTTELTLDNTTVRRYEMPLGMKIDNDFRIEVDWTNGSTTNPAKINRLEIIGDSPE